MTSDANYHRIKAATRDLIKACGGVERSAEITDMSTSEVSRWQSSKALRYIVPLDAVLALEEDCGMPLVTTVMASINGRRLSEPDGEGGASTAAMARFADLLGSFSTMASEASLAFKDFNLSHAENEILTRALGDVQRKAEALQRDLAAGRAGAELKVV